MVKNLPANAEDVGSIPGLGRFPGEEMVTHSRGGVKSGGSWKIFWPQHCPPDTKLSRDKPVSSVTLYALSAAKEVLHFPLFSLPSN